MIMSFYSHQLEISGKRREERGGELEVNCLRTQVGSFWSCTQVGSFWGGGGGGGGGVALQVLIVLISSE